MQQLHRWCYCPEGQEYKIQNLVQNRLDNAHSCSKFCTSQWSSELGSNCWVQSCASVIHVNFSMSTPPGHSVPSPSWSSSSPSSFCCCLSHAWAFRGMNSSPRRQLGLETAAAPTGSWVVGKTPFSASCSLELSMAAGQNQGSIIRL